MALTQEEKNKIEDSLHQYVSTGARFTWNSDELTLAGNLVVLSHSPVLTIYNEYLVRINGNINVHSLVDTQDHITVSLPNLRIVDGHIWVSNNGKLITPALESATREIRLTSLESALVAPKLAQAVSLGIYRAKTENIDLSSLKKLKHLYIHNCKGEFLKELKQIDGTTSFSGDSYVTLPGLEYASSILARDTCTVMLPELISVDTLFISISVRDDATVLAPKLKKLSGTDHNITLSNNSTLILPVDFSSKNKIEILSTNAKVFYLERD
jgi:hypothetical protein